MARGTPSLAWIGALVAALLVLPALGEAAEDAPEAIEETVVATRAALLGFREAHANNLVDAAALQAANPATDVLGRLNRLPGVIVTHGDAVGGNDWSNRVYIRGMSNGTDTAEIGYMVDGMPNGDPVYGSGQKPGAFVDHENVAAVQVAQNTADLATASNSALGGTIRYRTSDPAANRGFRLGLTGGEHGLRRVFARVDSGDVRGQSAYLSVSDAALDTWIGAGSGRFERQHGDLKIVKRFAGGVVAKLKAGWNDRYETDYNSITLADFRANPASDLLLDDFDIHTAAYWRPGWGGTRRAKSAALELSRVLPGAATAFTVTPYIHHQRAGGWWVPPYRTVTLNGRPDGPEAVAEFYRGTFTRDAGGGLVSAPGTSVATHACLRGRYPDDAVNFALAADFACDAAERIATRRRSGYRTDRFGMTGEAQRTVGRHTLTVGGWLERQRRDNDRRWFDLDERDPGTVKPAPSALHWIHFDRRFDSTSGRFYLADRMAFGPLAVTAALVWHRVETQYAARLEAVEREQARTEWLPKLGATYAWRPDAELFASYSRTVLMLGDDLLAAGSTAHLRPELADDIDVGLRWNGDRAGLVAQVFAQRFRGRLGAINLAAVGGNLYAQGAIEVLNVGGVDNAGVELTASFRLRDTLTAYGAYSYLAAEYADAVPAEGIVAGNPLVNAPRHQWFAELAWQPTAAWRLKWNAKHVGERAADLTGEEFVPAYVVQGVGIEYAGRLARLQLNASNLANERYLAAPDGDQGGTFFLGPARMISATVWLEF